MENKEIWKDIEGFEGKYQISNMGRVKSLERIDNNNHPVKEKIMKSVKDSGGYLQVKLYKDGKYKSYLIHRLVASAFIPNPNNFFEVNHIDENKTDNRVDNLEWCDSKYNMNYGTRTKRASASCRKTILQFTKDGKLVRKWDSATQVERELGFHNSGICMCCKGKQKTCGGYRWKYYYKGIWLKNHIPLIKQKKVA